MQRLLAILALALATVDADGTLPWARRARKAEQPEGAQLGFATYGRALEESLAELTPKQLAWALSLMKTQGERATILDHLSKPMKNEIQDYLLLRQLSGLKDQSSDDSEILSNPSMQQLSSELEEIDTAQSPQKPELAELLEEVDAAGNANLLQSSKAPSDALKSPASVAPKSTWDELAQEVDEWEGVQGAEDPENLVKQAAHALAAKEVKAREQKRDLLKLTTFVQSEKAVGESVKTLTANEPSAQIHHPQVLNENELLNELNEVENAANPRNQMMQKQQTAVKAAAQALRDSFISESDDVQEESFVMKPAMQEARLATHAPRSQSAP